MPSFKWLSISCLLTINNQYYKLIAIIQTISINLMSCVHDKLVSKCINFFHKSIIPSNMQHVNFRGGETFPNLSSVSLTLLLGSI